MVGCTSYEPREPVELQGGHGSSVAVGGEAGEAGSAGESEAGSAGEAGGTGLGGLSGRTGVAGAGGSSAGAEPGASGSAGSGGAPAKELLWSECHTTDDCWTDECEACVRNNADQASKNACFDDRDPCKLGSEMCSPAGRCTFFCDRAGLGPKGGFGPDPVFVAKCEELGGHCESGGYIGHCVFSDAGGK